MRHKDASGRTLSDVVGGILDAADRVRANYASEFGEARFLDPTDMPRDLPEGAAYAGIPVRYRSLLPEGVIKEMFKGGTPPCHRALHGGTSRCRTTGLWQPIPRLRGDILAWGRGCAGHA